MTTDFETTFLSQSGVSGGTYQVLVRNLTKNTQVTAAGIQAGADTTNPWTGNYSVLEAAVGDEIIVTFEGRDETTGGNDMLFLKAESDEPVYATIGGLIDDANILYLNISIICRNPIYLYLNLQSLEAVLHSYYLRLETDSAQILFFLFYDQLFFF